MSGKVPGTICSTRVGDEWIDDGTLCRARSTAPGVVGAANPAKAAFDKAHGYSLAPEARRKRAIDIEILGGDYGRSSEVSLGNAGYLRRLIEIGSGGRIKVATVGAAGELQFFVVRGGGEGFLPDGLRSTDARSVTTSWTDTEGRAGKTVFDENDVIAVFNAGGGLVGAARLRRPVSVSGRIGAATTSAVFGAWDRKTVSVYRNQRPGWIPYLGLAIADGFRDGSANDGRRVAIDIHKTEATNGCILIVDPKTPGYQDPALHSFEPALIRNALAALGIDETKVGGHATVLGTMRVVTIRL